MFVFGNNMGDYFVAYRCFKGHKWMTFEGQFLGESFYASRGTLFQ